MLKDKIKEETNKALKSGDGVKVSTLRMLSTALHNAKIEKKGDLTKEEEQRIVNSEAKKRKDAIEIFEKVGANEKAVQEKKELNILEEYLPKQMSDGELVAIIEKAVEKYKQDLPADATPQALQAGMGKVMGAVMGKTKGLADGNRVSALVKEKLS